jgi:hypothetical protein
MGEKVNISSMSLGAYRLMACAALLLNMTSNLFLQPPIFRIEELMEDGGCHTTPVILFKDYSDSYEAVAKRYNSYDLVFCPVLSPSIPVNEGPLREVSQRPITLVYP